MPPNQSDRAVASPALPPAATGKSNTQQAARLSAPLAPITVHNGIPATIERKTRSISSRDGPRPFVACPRTGGEGGDEVGALHRFEQRLEHMVTGAFARAFRSAVQPVEIASALQREVDNSAQILSRDRRLAPNDFTIELSGSDYDRLSAYGQSLLSELATMMHGYAAEQQYMFAGPLRLNFQRADDLTTGRFRVRSVAAAAVTPGPGQPADPSDTAIGRAPMFLEVNGGRHPLEPPGLVVGRGGDAGLRVDDAAVSRRHVEFRVRETSDGTQLSVVDLGSTNGTTVDGRRVQHANLSDGSLVQVGNTRILVRMSDRTTQARPYPPAPYQPPAARPQPYRTQGHAQPYEAQPYEAQPYQPQPYEPQPYPPQPPSDGPSQRRRGA
jgi:hypothetical protein